MVFSILRLHFEAFRELDSDGSGEIEFFEFVEWFTSED